MGEIPISDFWVTWPHYRHERERAGMAAPGDTIEVLHRLTPIGVAMAGADTFDPHKD